MVIDLDAVVLGVIVFLIIIGKIEITIENKKLIISWG